MLRARSVRYAALCLSAALLLGYGNATIAADDEEVIEEIIVTGSFIRRDNFDLPSPMNVVDETDLELAGTADLGDVIFDQTFQYGVNANATPFEGLGADDQQWNQGQEVWANLRGLGTRATMTMMDGHRLPADVNTWGRRAGVDINGTYPQIAIGRIETILDGASALYGSEAVGGVINLIPKKNFEGLEISYDYQQALEDGAPIRTASILTGIQGERGGAIFALEVRDTERMRYTDRPEYIVSAADPWVGQVWTPWWHDAGGRSSPSEFNVPLRLADGTVQAQWSGPLSAPWLVGDHPVGHASTGPAVAVQRADPGCGYGFGAGNNDWNGTPQPGTSFANPQSTYNDLQKPGNFLNGMFHAHSNIFRGPDCIMSVSDMQDMQAQGDANKGFAYFEYKINDNLELRGEIVVSTSDYNTRDVTGGFDEVDSATFLGRKAPIVIGENPGNPFRAFADGSSSDGVFVGANDGYVNWDDLDGDGLYDYGVEPGEFYVFAADANGDGIPDRDFDGDGIADAGAQGDPAAAAVLLSLVDDSDGDGIADRFDQDMLGNGGLRLFEDVRVRGGELNVNPKNPRNNTVEFLKDDGGSLVYLRRRTRDNIRLRLGAEFAIPNTDWILDADWILSQGKRRTQYPEPLLTEYVNGLRCQAGVNGDQCWNPFSTTYLNTTPDGQLIGAPSINHPGPDDPGWRPFNDPAVNTELENRNAGIILAFQEQVFGMQILDVVASTGSLFELPYNDMPVGFAIGGTYRLETEEWAPHVQNQAAIGGGKIGLRTSEQETNAIFAELQIPVLEHEKWGSAEIQLAVRYAEIETRGKIGQFGKANFEATIPKLAFRYSPNDWLSIRGSLTEGFVTPGLFTLFGESGTFGGNVGSVGDYVCDYLPEIEDCAAAATGGGVPDVTIGNSPNSSLGAETSDLWNAGISFRLFEGDLVLDMDFTTVDFKGRVEQIGGATNVWSNAIGFEDYVIGRCPGTIVDWDNPSRPGVDPAIAMQTKDQYRASVGQAELDCRLNAALSWVNTDANGGIGERALGASVLVRDRGPNGLGLTSVEDPWVQQGEQTIETMIYALRYRFDSEQVPFVGGDYGTFMFTVSATQMLEASITRYTSLGCDTPGANGLCPGDNPLAGITVDGVGNRNATSFVGPGEGLYSPLPPAPEFRVNLGLRWFYGNHTAQLSGRWHDSITNNNIAWDEQRDRGLLSAANAAITEKERCSQQPSVVCGFEAEHYWDVSYSYNHPDFMGANVNLNLAVRNIFDNRPTPKTTPAGHEGYLDNIMGRIGFARLSVSL